MRRIDKGTRLWLRNVAWGGENRLFLQKEIEELGPKVKAQLAEQTEAKAAVEELRRRLAEQEAHAAKQVCARVLQSLHYARTSRESGRTGFD